MPHLNGELNRSENILSEDVQPLPWDESESRATAFSKLDSLLVVVAFVHNIDGIREE